MIDQYLLRKSIRVVLSALPKGRRASENLLFAKLQCDLSDLRVDELRREIEWNQSKGYIDFKRNGDEDRDEWFLTDSGWAKEGM